MGGGDWQGQGLSWAKENRLGFGIGVRVLGHMDRGGGLHSEEWAC